MATTQTSVTKTVDEAILQRYSVRGFLDKPVPADVMREIFEVAQHAPSNCNAQPWNCYVASGAARDRIRDKMVKRLMGGDTGNPDYHYDAKFEGIYRERQVDCAVALYKSMGIDRKDSGGRMRAMMRNFELFDAPHVCFIGMQKDFREPVAIDVGLYLQSLMLAMEARGISSCAQGSMRQFPDIVREEFGAPDNIGIIVGLSFGYEDPDVPANRTRVGRAPLSENVTFLD